MENKLLEMEKQRMELFLENDDEEEEEYDEEYKEQVRKMTAKRLKDISVLKKGEM